MVSDFEHTECGGIFQARQLVLGKVRPYMLNAEGEVEEAGITFFNVSSMYYDIAQVRVEDMCGNIGIAVVPRSD